MIPLNFQVVNDNDGFKSEANIFLNDGENCGAHKNCGRNRRLNLKVVSGNNGIIQYVANAPIPGAYNYTFNIFHNGNSVVNKRYLNYLSNEDLFPTTYEVYPQINSVSPQAGSAAGGTLLTITGTGFTEDGMGGTVEVMVGEDLCKVESMTETEIKCRTVGGPEEPPTYAATKKFTQLDLSTSHYHRKHYDLEKVPTYEECEDRCRVDATCEAFLFQEQDPTYKGCWIIDNMGM